MDVIVVAEYATAWLLTDLLGRAMGTIVQETNGFVINPAGEAQKTMGMVNRGPHKTLDVAPPRAITELRLSIQAPVLKGAKAQT